MRTWVLAMSGRACRRPHFGSLRLDPLRCTLRLSVQSESVWKVYCPSKCLANSQRIAEWWE
ncbi:hypothetical protein PSET11_02042 [Arthrobacter ulcerisalmonis]|uniref:Uncharacterized protein n=1 Tax=Arthrobacter ulcerisalmonis TaxID=2483813 RepID=A0A3P5X953_9MICC|nr:hypothetical protein PSET11_02042 [Arthrobacter ulcerisalmonis]